VFLVLKVDGGLCFTSKRYSFFLTVLVLLLFILQLLMARSSEICYVYVCIYVYIDFTFCLSRLFCLESNNLTSLQ